MTGSSDGLRLQQAEHLASVPRKDMLGDTRLRVEMARCLSGTEILAIPFRCIMFDCFYPPLICKWNFISQGGACLVHARGCDYVQVHEE